MLLAQEIRDSRKKIHKDGYDMSFGELASIYERGELVISPAYQRLFRWEESQKTRFIESLLLNIPLPPIFVFMRDDGVWELIDGLQRVSTFLQFCGILKDAEGKIVPAFACEGTRLLPSLSGAHWGNQDNLPEGENLIELESSQKIAVQRVRLRVEILDQETDSEVKYELFQRLNTGGSRLTEQEIRDCIISSIDEGFGAWVDTLANNDTLLNAAALSETKLQQRYNREMIVRFLAYRHVPYSGSMDIHEYLDSAILALMANSTLNKENEGTIFTSTLEIISNILGDRPFTRERNKFSIAKYEFLVLGVSRFVENNSDKTIDEMTAAIRNKVERIDELPDFVRLTGAGVNGTRRLSQLIFGIAEGYFINEENA